MEGFYAFSLSKTQTNCESLGCIPRCGQLTSCCQVRGRHALVLAAVRSVDVASVVARCAAAARKRGSSLKAPLDRSSSSPSAQKSADSSRYRRGPAAVSSCSTCHRGGVQAISFGTCTLSRQVTCSERRGLSAFTASFGRKKLTRGGRQSVISVFLSACHHARTHRRVRQPR